MPAVFVYEEMSFKRVTLQVGEVSVEILLVQLVHFAGDPRGKIVVGQIPLFERVEMLRVIQDAQQIISNV